MRSGSGVSQYQTSVSAARTPGQGPVSSSR